MRLANNPLLKWVSKDSLFSRHASLALVVLFALGSNALANRAASIGSFAMMETEEITTVVEAISPFTAPIAENVEQVKISLTSGPFVGSDTPAALPSEYSHTVAKGETLASIASSYNVYVSDILALNEIKPDQAARVSISQTLRIPAQAGSQDLTWLQIANEARRKAEEEAARARLAAAARVPRTSLTRSGNVEILGRQSSGARNNYPFGWCTYWVAAKRYVPSRWGNAKSWLSSARAAGWATGSDPQVGAIVVTTENRFYGHVAYVEAVSGGNITISEMNYRGWGVVSRRTIPAHGGVVRGYIY